MKKQTVKTNQIIAVLQIVAFIFSQNAFAASDATLNPTTGQFMSVLSATTTPTQTPTQTIAYSNPNYATYQIDSAYSDACPSGCHDLYVLDKQTGVASFFVKLRVGQTTIGGTVDVSPDGKFAVAGLHTAGGANDYMVVLNLGTPGSVAQQPVDENGHSVLGVPVVKEDATNSHVISSYVFNGGTASFKLMRYQATTQDVVLAMGDNPPKMISSALQTAYSNLNYATYQVNSASTTDCPSGCHDVYLLNRQTGVSSFFVKLRVGQTTTTGTVDVSADGKLAIAGLHTASGAYDYIVVLKLDTAGAVAQRPVDKNGNLVYGIALKFVNGVSVSPYVFDRGIVTFQLMQYGVAVAKDVALDARTSPPQLIFAKDVVVPAGAIVASSNSNYYVYGKNIAGGSQGLVQIFIFDKRIGESVLMTTVDSWVHIQYSGFDVSPSGRWAMIGLTQGSTPEPGDRTMLFDVVKQVEVKPIDSVTGQTINGIPGTTGALQFIGKYAVMNRYKYGDAFQSTVILDFSSLPIVATSSNVFASPNKYAALSPDGKYLEFSATDAFGKQVVGTYYTATRTVQVSVLPVKSVVIKYQFISGKKVKMTLQNGQVYYLNLNYNPPIITLS